MIKLSADTAVCVSDVKVSKRITLINIKKHSSKHLTVLGPFPNLLPMDGKHYFDIETGERYQDAEVTARSVRRAKNAIVDLAKMNSFTHFGTLTLDDKLQDATNVVYTTKKLLKALKNYSLMAQDFKYIVVPEFGTKYGRLHFHFLMKGIRKTDLYINENGKLDFKYFRKRFGFVQITEIGKSRADIERTAIYCGKYMGKENIQIGTHRYFASQGLIRVNKVSIYSAYTAKIIANFMTAFPQFKYYEDKAVCYDIPQPIFEKLQEHLLEKWCKVAYQSRETALKYKQYWELI